LSLLFYGKGEIRSANGQGREAKALKMPIVFDLMFQRGQIAFGAAASIMMLLALATALVPYAVWTTWRSRRGASRG
jgi:glucose/mannose transport system permease protein